MSQCAELIVILMVPCSRVSLPVSYDVNCAQGLTSFDTDCIEHRFQREESFCSSILLEPRDWLSRRSQKIHLSAVLRCHGNALWNFICHDPPCIVHFPIRSINNVFPRGLYSNWLLNVLKGADFITAVCRFCAFAITAWAEYNASIQRLLAPLIAELRQFLAASVGALCS